MSFEIERKFLIRGKFKHLAESHSRIVQGYLSSVPERSVRIRIRNDKGYITIKGKGNDSGMSRYEWEKEIDLKEAEELIQLCEPGIIDKTRYLIPYDKYTIEADEFHGENKGLLMAEVELESEDDIFEIPDWLGEEVTGDKRYYNAYLSKKPYSIW